MAQNLGYRHGETMLREHGRARTKERQAEMGKKVARGCRATWHGVAVPRAVFAASSAWRLGLFGGVFFSWRPGFFQGENSTFQILYKEGQA